MPSCLLPVSKKAQLYMGLGRPSLHFILKQKTAVQKRRYLYQRNKASKEKPCVFLRQAFCFLQKLRLIDRAHNTTNRLTPKDISSVQIKPLF